MNDETLTMAGQILFLMLAGALFRWLVKKVEAWAARHDAIQQARKAQALLVEPQRIERQHLLGLPHLKDRT